MSTTIMANRAKNNLNTAQAQQKFTKESDFVRKIAKNALLPNPIFRKVMPTDYKLFQVTDFICTMELLNLKLENNLFSKSEMIFFGSKRNLKQNYLKDLKKKEWN